ncbi:MAG: hypothetical protein M0R03_00340 [Novosphingobium sp.]|nr:hypothetical protein [Novosphingobium sp.]
MRTVWVLVPLLAASACGREPTPEEQTASDKRAVEMVEAAQNRKPPVIAVVPQQITFGDVQQNRISGMGCAFLPNGSEGGDPVLYADGERGVMKIDGAIEVFAADSGSGEQPYGTRAHYSGKTWDLRVASQPGEGVPAGEESATWNAGMTLRDQFGRIVWSAAGTLVCGS